MHTRPAAVLFVCPGQPNLKLSLSKLYDHVCDCCNGADEVEGECNDNCEELLAEERAARQALQTSYTSGATQRAKILADAKRQQAMVQHTLTKQHMQLHQLDKQFQEQREQLQNYKLRFARERITVVAKTAHGLREWLEPLTNDELVWFIVHACQWSGEHADQPVPESVKTCLPLRLAALDHGILWHHLSYELVRVGVGDGATDGKTMASASSSSDLERLLAELLHHNAAHPDDPSHIIYNEYGWNTRKPKEESSDNGQAGTAKNARNHKRHQRAAREHSSGDNDDEVPNYSNDEDDDYAYQTDGNNHEEGEEAASRHASTKSRPSKPLSHQRGDDNEAWSDSRDGDETTTAPTVKRVVDSKPVVEAIQQRTMSHSRKSFLDQSGPLLETMQAVLDDLSKKEEDERKAEQEKRRREMEERRRKKKEAMDGNVVAKAAGNDVDSAAEAASVVSEEEAIVEVAKDDAAAVKPSTPHFDPVALPMARDKLTGWQSRVQKGFQHAVSAKILLDILLESSNASDGDQESRNALLREDLYQLALGTSAHGKLSALQVWQVYLHVVPGLIDSSIDTEGGSKADRETCVSQWAPSCPPKTLERTSPSGAVVTIPPKVILQAADTFCAQQYDVTIGGASAEACAASAWSADGGSIPTDIPDGFLGYYEARPRAEDDLLHRVLQPLTLHFPKDSRKELDDLLSVESRIKTERTDLHRKINEAKESVGLDNPDKYGTDGELFALRNDCYTYDTGKYVYEVCLFGAAKQKEGPGSGGTNLGSWSEATVDDKTGQRVWKWLNGNKCWNGPNRSLTAFITCGPTTRILAVEEPEICKYVMQMESYIACDDAFRQEHGLEE